MRRASFRNESGQAITEMALVLPILLSVLLGIAQFGIVFNNYITLTDATRAGARKAAVARFTGDAGAAATALVYSSASSLKAPDLQVSVVSASDWSVPGSDVTVTASYPYSIDILGLTVKSGHLTSTQKGSLE